LYALGNRKTHCSNNYDEMWNGIESSLKEKFICKKDSTSDCDSLKEFIRQSSTNSSNISTTLMSFAQENLLAWIPFDQFCDSVWHVPSHIDESPSLCQQWGCSDNKYQCQTGQCIPLEWVCDGEWDCSDASDEEAIVIIKEWSLHNGRLTGLNKRRNEYQKWDSRSPFSKICNTSFEFGCYQSGVSNPLDIELNRPCINLTQIGDGIEDCYNAYDERNTFKDNSFMQGMWDFSHRCGNEHEIYPHVCLLKDRNCTKILWSYHRDKDGRCFSIKDAICLDNGVCKKNARCDGKSDCFHGEDEYWCPSGSYKNQHVYRYDKMIKLIYTVELSFNALKPMISLRNNSLFIKHSYQCDRGIAVIEIMKQNVSVRLHIMVVGVNYF
jgi:hypothetical protein